MSFDLDPHEVVSLLNEMLALDPELVLKLVSNRPEINNLDLREVMKMKGTKISFLGIINAMFRRQNADIIIGADCEFEDGEMIYVKFFHILETRKDDD